MFHWRKKYGSAFFHTACTFIIIAVAVVLRLFLIAQGWPGSNSDEGTMGLEAMHIAYRGELPVFLYGQNYMGTIEAYLAAAAFRLFGVSFFSLRLGMVLLFTLFLISMYFFARLLFTKYVALISIGLLCLGSSEIFTRELKVLGGDLETILFGTLALLLSCSLALSYQGKDGVIRRDKKRLLTYGCLGLVMGLGIWSHMLILPFIFVSLLLLCLFCRREIRSRTTLFWLLGLLIGMLPLLIYNVEYPAQNSIATLLQLHHTGGTVADTPYTWWDLIRGTVLISLPKETGAFPLCTVSSTPGAWMQQVSSCMFFQGTWGVVFLLIWVIALIFALRELRGWRVTTGSARSFEERQLLVKRTARLLLLSIVGLILLSYLTSPAPALVPDMSSRYLVGLFVATPAFVAPLVSLHLGSWKPVYLAIASAIGRISVLLFVFVILLNGTINILSEQVPSTIISNQQNDTLISDLLSIHAAHIYSDYWTCDNLIFQSDERIICSVLDDNLQPGQNRYPLYATIVQADKNASYVFKVDPTSHMNDDFKLRAVILQQQYRHFVFALRDAQYDVYQPVRR